MPKFLQFASITKKITLAIIGLFLMLFLLVHLGINLCMLRSDGGAWFRAAAHFMGTNYLVKAFEIVLFAAVALHILLGILIQLHNWRARPVRYASASRSKTASGSKFMIWTGLLILLFLGLHFVNFYFAKLGWVEGRYVVEMKVLEKMDVNKMDQQKLVVMFANPDKESAAVRPFLEVAENVSKADIVSTFGPDFKDYEPDFYTMALQLFKNVWAVVIYLVLLLALGIHLNHAFQSAFQTLGLVHSKYTPAVKIVGSLYAVVIALGFMVIPVSIYLFM